jgi:hypothetical protein
MGCFSAEKPEYKLPKWMRQPVGSISRGVGSALNQSFTPYTGDRTADMSGTQNDAMAMFRELMGESAGGVPRLIDDIPGMGPLAGNLKDYMDPYLASVLNPALRELGVARTDRMQDIDRERNMAGAFGDTGAAIDESLANQDYLRAVGDTTGQISSQAFNSAMGLRSDDINRLVAQRGQKGDWLKDMFNMGGVEQATQQRDLDADFQEFMRQIGWDWEKLAKASSIMGSLPSGQMTPGGPSTAGQLLGGLSSAAAFFI